MWEVTGIVYTNCTFNNLSAAKGYNSDGGNGGIYSIDAGYAVNAGCSSSASPCPSQNVLKSSFTGFRAGIEALDNVTTNTITVDQSMFTDNLSGVIIHSVNNAAVTRNEFTFGGFSAISLTPGVAHHGVQLDHASGYTIEENKFNRTLNTTVGLYGIYNNQSGPSNNRIYKNEFTDMYTGNYNHGVNKNSSDNTEGYQSLCNKFDHFIDGGIKVYGTNSSEGIRYYQGDPVSSVATGNIFVNLVSESIGLSNTNSVPLLYFYNGANSNPTVSGAVTQINVANQNQCPSNFVSGGFVMSGGLQLSPSQLTQFTNDLTTMEPELLNLKYTLSSMLDDGNTQNLIRDIGENWSNDAWELRDQLISRSPNVSRDGIIAAIGKHILPHAMILEICLANPESIKGEDFIEKLRDVSNNSIPEYIYENIRANWYEESSRSVLEKAIAHVGYEVQTRRNLLLTSLLNSEEVTDQEIVTELDKLQDSYSVFDKIMKYVEIEDFISAMNVLNTISYGSREDVALFENLVYYIDLISDVRASGRKISQLDSTEISQLVLLSSGPGKVAEIARNVLCFFYNRCVENEAIIENMTKTMMAVQGSSKEALNQIYYAVSVFPNPANNYTSVKYSIFEQLVDPEIKVYSSEGKLIETLYISENEGEKLIDTRKLKNGLYYFTIVNSGEAKVSDKFIVSHD
ncbi:T9SS type A sorting domain-containing protein [Fluviicola sp.]|jgi:hypothetical protein|uniref:T9SS type A sorting domain-containing protein n=1 Tax=Fluviicola sp. TaxID=1917219 RepID=UPI0028251BA1|nr:T9SS type A sorting domain-containing protein [Fluviicola sp.]MDR0802730.1 T9SS type A sorting domain-containing protein [Fluviicola sp.]